MITTQYNALRTSGHGVSARDVTHQMHSIGILIFDGFSMLPVAEVIDVFDKANRILAAGPGGLPCYRTAFVSRHGGCVSSSAELAVMTQRPEQLPSVRTLFVACGGEVPAKVAADLQFRNWLCETACRADEVFAIGNGDSLLSAISAPAGRTDLKRQNVVPGDSSLAGPTRFGTRSAVRQALELVRQDFGIAFLRRVLELIPDTGMPEFNAMTSDSAKSIRDKIHESAQWIARNCNRAISVTVAAQTAGMSERSYLRHFRAEMGVKPSEYLRRSRVELAAAILESSDLPVDKIARRCGLTSGECLARLFRQILDVSPTEYRSRMRSANERRGT
ncbi:helix-turn-helix domain-containing protein [Paraburkholderia phymatum]|uniref:Transcriptional regulator, AraC family n=1 Tax=Paraburkholderia phymatum (strain DSM 17167 / CIP 108236 / LMG 21445 / STM815) TaxID=391038 RepID=B2JS47_PARP8|nr:helix-turn-helix domain-containing protein [Paraburkholderia phymatum]ACC72424.1 transcriptional regulator, AraC family [Paraburkholderia phymatum STM815]